MKKTFTLKNNYTGKVDENCLTTVDVDIVGNDMIFDFDCKNSTYYCAGDKYNDPLYNGCVCEAFICVDGSRKDYFEIEVAPNGAVFFQKIKYLCYHAGAVNHDADIAHEQMPENFIKTSVTKYGENNYKLHFSVPLDKLGYDGSKKVIFNTYRIEIFDVEGNRGNLYASFPTLCDFFHRPEYYQEF